MTTLPADEDYARALLTIFDTEKVRPGQSLRAASLSVEFSARGMGRTADYEAALTYALDQGWLTLEFGMARLTKAGFAEI
jgi:hypothetical protein